MLLEPKNSAALRHAFGCFATGVTIVAAASEDGSKVGITANSFTSVSIDPPLLLVSLSRTLRSLKTFSKARYFAVNVLAADQGELARTFASSSMDKWLNHCGTAGVTGAPIISDAVAVFECETVSVMPAGDHDLYLGHIIGMSACAHKEPLVFHGGKFTALALSEARGA